MQEILNQILEKTKQVFARYEELDALVSSPEIIAHNSYWRKLLHEQSSIENIALSHKALTNYIKDLDKIKLAIKENKSDEFIPILIDESNHIEKKIENLTNEIIEMLLPKDENDNKNVVIEIRYVEGGENGTLFCFDLFNMYQNFSKLAGFSFEIVDISYCEDKGIKYASAIISGIGAYSALKYESGTHKANGSVKAQIKSKASSVCSVAILPEIEAVEVDIKDADLRIDVFNSSGAGGQNVNKLETAIRITHLPTGIVVTCQDERSQLKNKERAMKLIRAKLYDLYKSNQEMIRNNNRKAQIRSNESIRTYNYIKCNVTDHRVNFSVSLDSIFAGKLHTFIDAVNIKEKDDNIKNFRGI